MSAAILDLSSGRVLGLEQNRSPRSVRDLSILLLVTLIARVPFLGVAEPDSALFATGARQWLRGGPTNLSIYSAQVCAVYYASVTAIVRLLHLGEENCVLVMSILSVIACLGIVTFGYLLGMRLVGPKAAFGGMLLFTFSPGLWWTSVEPHPQAVSICFGLAGIWSFVRHLEQGKSAFGIGSILGLALAMAIKNDAVLLAPALFAMVFWIRPSWRNFMLATIVTGCAAGLSLLLTRWALGPVAHPVSGGKQALERFARLPHLFDLVREGAPIVFGIGLITAILLAFVLAYALVKHPDRRRWMFVLALWCLPGYAFWLCIAGNDIRHVLIFGLPLFWFGATSLRMRYVVVCLTISLLVPPNSNVFMFPSPNVPGSAILFAHKKQEMGMLADRLSATDSCFTGSYTDDYMVNALLDRGGRIESQLSDTDVSSRTVRMANGVVITLNRISTSKKQLDLGPCRSLEYSEAGHKVRFLGGEWRIPIV